MANDFDGPCVESQGRTFAATYGRVTVAAWCSWTVIGLGVGCIVHPDRVEATIGLPFCHLYLDVTTKRAGEASDGE